MKGSMQQILLHVYLVRPYSSLTLLFVEAFDAMASRVMTPGREMPEGGRH